MGKKLDQICTNVEKRREKVREMRDKGISRLDIARELKTSIAVVGKDINVLGISKQGSGHVKGRREQLKKIYNGQRQAKLAEYFKVSQATIHADLIELGLIERKCKTKTKPSQKGATTPEQIKETQLWRLAHFVGARYDTARRTTV